MSPKVDSVSSLRLRRSSSLTDPQHRPLPRVAKCENTLQHRLCRSPKTSSTPQALHFLWRLWATWSNLDLRAHVTSWKTVLQKLRGYPLQHGSTPLSIVLACYCESETSEKLRQHPSSEGIGLAISLSLTVLVSGSSSLEEHGAASYVMLDSAPICVGILNLPDSLLNCGKWDHMPLFLLLQCCSAPVPVQLYSSPCYRVGRQNWRYYSHDS